MNEQGQQAIQIIELDPSAVAQKPTRSGREFPPEEPRVPNKQGKPISQMLDLSAVAQRPTCSKMTVYFVCETERDNR
jgi:hypothetical protein